MKRKVMSHPYTKISVISPIVIVLLLSSCNFFDSDDVSEPPVNEPSEIFKEGIIIWIIEQTAGPELRLMLRTKGEFNYTSIDFEVVDDYIDSEFTREIIINGILEHPEWRPRSELAQATSHVPFFDIEGELNLIIRDGPFTDSFNVNITEEKVDISILDTTFTEVAYDRYYRRPPNSMFFSCGTIEAKKHLCEELHELMKAEANLREFQFPDDGEIPYPKQSVEDFEYNAAIRFYLYDSSEDYRHAGQLLVDFADENGISNEDNWLFVVNWQELAYSSYYMIF